MDFPVTAEFVATANAAQLHAEARGVSPAWPASFVQTVPDDDSSWVYRIDDTDEYVEDDPETGEPVECTRQRADVAVDVEAVQAALDGHVPAVPQTTAERVDALPDPTTDFPGFKTGLAALLGGG